jgi:hypothetical protein
MISHDLRQDPQTLLKLTSSNNEMDPQAPTLFVMECKCIAGRVESISPAGPGARLSRCVFVQNLPLQSDPLLAGSLEKTLSKAQR